MDEFYLCSYLGTDVRVSSDVFAFYIGTMKYILNYELLDEIKYLDVLGGSYRCFYYIDSEGFIQYVGFNNVEV